MTNGVIYLLTGAKHAARLVVSLVSLRRHFDGPVIIYTTQGDSHEIGRQCALDRRLDVEHIETHQVAIRKNSSFITKIALLLEAPFEVTCYLDCDTLVTGDISPLLTVAAEKEFIATRFSNWVTTGKTIRKRIERWRGVKSSRFDVPLLVDSALETERPSVNGGVCVARTGASILQPWFDLAMDGRRTFICDEIALHLLLHHYPHQLLDCRWNNSSVYGVQDDVRIWHFHGGKHARRGKGAQLWLPDYQIAVDLNYAGLAQWGPGPDDPLAALLLENIS